MRAVIFRLQPPAQRDLSPTWEERDLDIGEPGDPPDGSVEDPPRKAEKASGKPGPVRKPRR